MCTCDKRWITKFIHVAPSLTLQAVDKRWITKFIHVASCTFFDSPSRTKTSIYREPISFQILKFHISYQNNHIALIFMISIPYKKNFLIFMMVHYHHCRGESVDAFKMILIDPVMKIDVCMMLTR